MNKKVLSAILFSALFAGTGTFTSCIDTDEPAGIEDLRGAKAELIRAKVAVEAANAAYVQAEAALKLAEAETEKAKARWENANAAIQEAKAEQEAAKTEEEKARVEKAIAEYNQQLQEIAVDLQKLLAKKEKELANAKFELEVALKQIEVAKALGLSDLNAATIDALEGEVEKAYEKIYGYDYENGLGGLVGKVYDAEKALYEAMLDKAAGFDENGNQDAYIPELELNAARKEANVAAKKEALAKLNEFLEKDAETTDWRAEIAELEDSINLLEKAMSEKDVEIAKAKKSPAALDAYQAWKGVKDENGNVVKDGTEQALTKAEANYNKYAQGGAAKKKLALSKIEVTPVAELQEEITAAVAAYNAESDNDVDNWNGTKFAFGKQEYYQPTYATKLTAANGYVPAITLAEVNAWIGALDKAIVSANDTELAKLKLAAAQKLVTDTEKANTDAVALWQVALNAAKGTATPVPTKLVDDAVTAYNTAFTNLTTKVTAYNTAFKAAVDAEFAKLKNDAFETLYLDAMATQLTSFGYTGLPAKGTLLYKVANHESFFGSNDLLTADQKKAEKDKMAEIKDKCEKDAAKEAIDKEKTWTEQAVNAAGDVKAVKDALDAITNTDPKKGALAALEAAYGKLDTEFAKYVALANETYAQVLTDDAKKLTFAGLTGVGAKVKPAETEYEVAATDWLKVEDNVYYVVRTEISAENKAKIAETKLDATLANAALLKTSNDVFKMDKSFAVAPTEAEVRAYAKAKPELLENMGTYGAYLAAQDALASLNNDIAAAEKLAEVKTAVAAAKTALEAEIAANEAQFATLKAAVVAADAANTAAKKAYEKIEAEIVNPLVIEKAQLYAKKEAASEVQGTLESAVKEHLGLDEIPDYAYDSFEDDLKAAVEGAEDEVIKAEKALAVAKKDLQLAQEGKYDAVATAQRELDAANAAMEKAMKEYNEALTNLETALAIMAGETAE